MKKRNIIVEKLEQTPVSEREVEIIERKGIGHPDTICDLSAEFSSRILSNYYLKKFGHIFHHNLDKALLIAGQALPKFGGGKILKQALLIIAGRATNKIGSERIDVEKIIKKELLGFLKEKLILEKPEKFFKIIINYQPGAENLSKIFEKKKVAIANDTSFGIAYAPLSLAEKLTLEVANLLNSPNFIKKFPFVGRDLKVMTLRRKKKVYITLAISYIDKFVKDVPDYFRKKEIIKEKVKFFVKRKFNFEKIFLFHNTCDNPKAKTEKEIYLTVSGMSLEQGDDGQVGRGNRVWGLITPLREMSLEAPAGKNINHPGKLYQILALLIAKEIEKIKGVRECYVELLSEIGKPLDQPKIGVLRINTNNNFQLIKEKAIKIANRIFEKLTKIQLEIIKGKYPIC